MRILRTGGTGFIGYNLVPVLQENRHEVICLVRETSNLSWLNSIGNVEYRYGDISVPDTLSSIVSDADCIIHMAGIVATVRNADFFRINHTVTRNLITAAKLHNPYLSKFILVSSLSAAGPSTPEQPKTEAMPDYPVSAYGESKLAAEQAVLEYQGDFGVVIVRPPIVYGPKDVGVQGFFRLAQQGWRIRFPWKNLLLSLVYVEDMARALTTLVTADIPSGALYYVSDPTIYSVPEIQSIIAGAMGKKVKTIPIPKTLLYPAAAAAEMISRLRHKPSFLNWDKLKEISQPAWTCSPEKITRDLGFHARYDLARGAAETAKWYRAHGWI